MPGQGLGGVRRSRFPTGWTDGLHAIGNVRYVAGHRERPRRPRGLAALSGNGSVRPARCNMVTYRPTMPEYAVAAAAWPDRHFAENGLGAGVRRLEQRRITGCEFKRPGIRRGHGASWMRHRTCGCPGRIAQVPGCISIGGDRIDDTDGHGLGPARGAAETSHRHPDLPHDPGGWLLTTWTRPPTSSGWRDEGTHYFLSRPRRFGKSLLLDTIKELFEGSEALFRGLAVHGRWDWSIRHPVVRLNFGHGDFKEPGLPA